MANKLTLDFENGVITFDTDYQKGEEICPDLAACEDAVLAAIGYSKVDLGPAVKAFNDFVNGKLSEEQLLDLVAQKE